MPRSFTIEIELNALLDIQTAIDYYEDQQSGLGKKFENTINKHIVALIKNPFFQVRYDNIRCLSVKKYPFIIHFEIYESKQLIRVLAVFHTSQNPKKWRKI